MTPRSSSSVSQERMDHQPICDDPKYAGSGKLLGKKVLITGGDSGIGRAIAILFAKEGAQVAFCYRQNVRDARKTVQIIEGYGPKAYAYKCDISQESHARKLVDAVAKKFQGLDILINNAAIQFPTEDFMHIKTSAMEKTFRTNVFALFYLSQAALKYFKSGSCIINTTSVTAFRGSEHLVDYASTKGAIVAFTRSLAKTLAEKNIRVNAVAPGPVWTPLIEATFSKYKQRTFGKKSAMGRAGEPVEIAPSYLFLASKDASFITGQTVHPNGGEIVNG